jgi:hypothetical protein
MAKSIKTHLKRIIIAGALAAISVISAWLVFIPTAEFSPVTGTNEVPTGSDIEIDVPRFSRVSKFSVFADDQLVGIEYNLPEKNVVRHFSLKPSQQVRVEAKITSVTGVTREFTSSFHTVAPVKIESMSVDGARYAPGQRISPRSSLKFSFSKPITQAALSFDGSGPIELALDPQDPATATLPPTFVFKQGETHLLEVSATATDSATLEPQKLRATVVKPLSLYGKVEESGGQIRVELDSTTPFADPEAVKAALETTLPDPTIKVEAQKIIISSAAPDHENDYSIKLARAEGADGSFLEAPLTLALSFTAESGTTYTGGQSYRGYVYTPGTSGSGPTASNPSATGSTGGSGGAAPAGGGAPAGSGPPPGWPPCCPWPPQ